MKAISLFSGAGGDTLGMTMSDIDVVGFVEIDPTYTTTHLKNFPDSEHIGADITDIPDETFLKYRGKVDMIFSGTPCQGFSKAGKKNPDDPRNQLYREFIRVVRIIQPKWIIGENVKNMMTMKDHDGKFIIHKIMEGFETIGYTLTKPTILKCCHYGIPQKRERCFFVGHRGSNNLFSFDKIPTLEERCLMPIIEESLEGAVETENNFDIIHTKKVKNLIPHGKPATNLVKCLHQGNLSVGKRASPIHSEILDLTKQAKTIICTYGRMPRQFVPLQDTCI
jgi:DNA (cytosine-5)-methyltransferase 1